MSARMNDTLLFYTSLSAAIQYVISGIRAKSAQWSIY